MATRRNSSGAKAGATAGSPAAENASASGRALPRKKIKRRKRSTREEFVSYLLRVTGWDCHYSFSVGDPKHRWGTGPYNQLTTLSLSGDLIRPDGCAYKRATLTFSARADMDKDDRQGPVNAIGSLSASEDELSPYIFIPKERVAELATIAASGRIQIVQFTATKLRYRSALIRNVSLYTRFDEEEW